MNSRTTHWYIEFLLQSTRKRPKVVWILVCVQAPSNSQCKTGWEKEPFFQHVDEAKNRKDGNFALAGYLRRMPNMRSGSRRLNIREGDG